MRHRSAAPLAAEPPQPQPSLFNSLPHRKKKRKRRVPGPATSTSVSSETSFANDPDQLKNRIHDAAVEFEQEPKGEQSISSYPLLELRQRSVKVGESLGNSVVTAVDAGDAKEVCSIAAATSETAESLELKRVLEDDSISNKSPMSYLFERVYYGNSVWSTTTIGDEKGRERVYDTIFRLPWRCELDADGRLEASENKVHCCSSIFSFSTLVFAKKFKRPSTVEFSDFSCFLILACGVTVLQQIAEELARCPPETQIQAITLSACIVSHYNALPALLVSNNFAEIKSYVFKGYSKDNVHSMVYSDSIERFHISAFILFVLAQNILEAEGPWFISFINNILLVYLFEMAIDVIKHSFISKFNNISPIAYSEFLEVLCKQTLHIQTEDAKKKLTFVPLAPACVVIRVLAPVYAANLPYNSLSWRLSWILLFSAITYIMLTSLKVLIGMVLQKHARWYVNRCQKRKHHLHAD
ncbi:Protein POLLEN DEFECTIVE IN GUIDANCE 1 [Vigna angularis]|uniref:Protein POLLEN DEFECTIVE IN GUIDANCE 1 n=1 Tax=Phaseolus angularis TaxID=3914 RepID=A0A8T0LDR6_PHAAN|nr:Protein POLLEN DEFECTIVE IN GUIDANCE 1 [Vigna angularis]